MSDELFREVDEEVRQDRHMEMWKRYGTYFVALVVVIVGATIAFVVWREMQESARMADSEQFLAAVVAEQTAQETALADLRTLAQDGTSGYRYLASLREASLLAEAGNTQEAVSIFDSLAADSDYSKTYRDLAQIYAVANGMDVMSRDEVESRLAPLNTPDNPFRFTAREFLAVAAISAGDNGTATELLRAIVEDRATPLATRARASELLALTEN